jgi:hypothetical protein
MRSPRSGALYVLQLRRELSATNHSFAREHTLLHSFSLGESPVVAYLPFEKNGKLFHGNFLPASYAAIIRKGNWKKRLLKPHSQARSSLPNLASGSGHRWKELDSSTSSDALLMNVFCYPRVFADGRVYRLLGVEAGSEPEFGIMARVPLRQKRVDRTEVDMRLGSLLVEAKLTESDFQCRSCAALDAYRDFSLVFDRKMLLRRQKLSIEDSQRSRPAEYVSYQLIRNVLAAHATGCSFCVIHDARRPDLSEAWYAVMRCVRDADLRTRCQVLTWQELSEALPPKLQQFLDEKYGIR